MLVTPKVVACGELADERAQHLAQPAIVLEVLAVLHRVRQPRLARRLQANDDALALRKRGLCDLAHARHLDRHAERAKEALVRAPELRHDALRRVIFALFDAQHLECRREAALHVRPKSGGLVVHLLLRLGQVDDELTVRRAREAQLAADVHAAPLHVERHELHRSRAAGRDRLLELGEIGEAGLRPPQSQSARVREVGDRRGARRRAVHDARARAELLQLLDGLGHLRALALRALAPACHRPARSEVRGRLLGLFVRLGVKVLGLVRLVEEDAALGAVAAQPLDDHLRALLIARRAEQRRVRGEEHTLGELETVDLLGLEPGGVGGLGDVDDAHVGRANVAQVALRIDAQVGRD